MIKQESRVYFRALGAHVSQLRKEQGMTQAELERAIGVSRQTVFAYELDDRRVSVLIIAKLAKVFGVSVEALMGMTRSPRPANPRLFPAGLRHAQCFEQLGRTDQRFVKKIIDVLLERKKSSPRRGRSDPPKYLGASQQTGDTQWTTRKLTKSFQHSQMAAIPPRARNWKAQCFSRAT